MLSCFLPIRRLKQAVYIRPATVELPALPTSCWAALLFITATVVGCDAGTNGYRGPTGKVAGRVTINGSVPPPGCMVLFQSPGTGYTAAAEIDIAGVFQLSFNGSPNIPAGLYKVQVTPPVSSARLSAPPDPSKPPSPPPRPFPAKYMSTNSSGIEFSVVAGTNTASFDLKVD